MGILDAAGNQPTHGLFDSVAQPTPRSTVDVPGLDDILSSEGAERVKPIMQAIVGQESGGNAGVGNSVDGAHGIAQIMPATFRQFAKPGESIDNPADNLRVAARLINHLYDKAGGDPAKIAAGYFSGEGNIGSDGAYKVDHADGNGKRVSSYVADVLGRMGGTAAAPADAPAVLAAAPSKKWTDVVSNPGFATLTPQERELARSEYFNRYVAPSIPDEERDAAKAQFIEKSKALDPKAPGMLDGVMNTLGDIRHGIRQVAGTLPEQIAADKLKARDGAGVMSGMDGLMPSPAAPTAPAAPAADTLGINSSPAAKMAAVNAAYATPTKDIFDPSADARARQLVRNGMDGTLANQVAADSAKRGLAPGQESGAASAAPSDFDFEARKKFTEDPFWKHPLVRGAVKGFEGYKQGILGINQAIGEAVGADVSGQAALAKDSRGTVDAMGESSDYLQRNFEGTISSISQQLPALIGGAATGSEGLVLGSMFAQTFGQEYSQGRSQGQEQGDALKRAGLYGAFEVIGEKFGLGHRMDMLRNAARGVETNVLAKWMGQTLTHELPGEEVTTLGQFMTDKLGGGVGLKQDGTFGDYLEQAADTLTQTVMQGGIMSGATGGVNAASHYMRHGLDHSGLDADAAQLNATNKWKTNGLSPANRVEPTLDAHAAGLSPEHRAVDAQARDAFADLTDPKLLDDEVPASTLLGAEAHDDTPAGEQAKVGEKYVRVTKNDGTTGYELDPASTPAQEPASMRPPEGSDIEAEKPAAPVEPTALAPAPEATAPADAEPAVDGKKTKLTPFEHPHLDDVDVRGELAYMADQAGWEQVGGKMIRADGLDQGSTVTGRTPWIPKQPWYQMMPERLNEHDTIEAVGKALTGQPMTAKEKRVIGNMLDFAKASLDEQQKWRDQVHEEVGATSAHEYEQIGQHADALEDLDADIPLDHNDPRLKSGDKLTDEDIDGIFGIKRKSSGVSQDAAPGNAREGAQGNGTSPAADGDAFLKGETADEVKAKERATEKTKAAERKAIADAEAKEKAERETKDIKARAGAAADNFQLGEDPEAALSGQKDIFGEAPAEKKAEPVERFGDRNNASVKGANTKIDRETESWGFKPGHFDKSTFSSGRIAPHFEHQEHLTVGRTEMARGESIKLGKGPNGKWGFGLDIHARPPKTTLPGTGTPALNDPVSPDARTQYNTREEAVNAALERIKAIGRDDLVGPMQKEAAKPPVTEADKAAARKKEKRSAGKVSDDLKAAGKKAPALANEIIETNPELAPTVRDAMGDLGYGDHKGRFSKAEYATRGQAETNAMQAELMKKVGARMGDRITFTGKEPPYGMQNGVPYTVIGLRAIRYGASHMGQVLLQRPEGDHPSDRRTTELGINQFLVYAHGKTGWAWKVNDEAFSPPKPAKDRFKTMQNGLSQAATDLLAVASDTRQLDDDVKMLNHEKYVPFDAALAQMREMVGEGQHATIPNTALGLGVDVEGAIRLIAAVKEDASAPKSTKATADDLDKMFDEVAAEEKAKDAAPKKATAADLDAMFDEVAAEEKAKDEKPKERHEMTQAENRSAPDRGNSSGLSFAKINLDNESVESLLKTHRKDIPALGALVGAKGGKNIPKLAADIMRVWKLRDTLSKSTVESIVKENDAAGVKALAKAVGIYPTGSKEALAKGIIKWRDDQRTKAADRLQDTKHFIAVKKALTEGKTVAANILKPYPELAVEHTARGSATYNAGIKQIAAFEATRGVGMEVPSVIKSFRADAAKATGKDAEVATDIADAIQAQYDKSQSTPTLTNPTPAAPVDTRTTGEVAVSAAKNAGAGMKNAALGLAKLFDAKGTVGSGPVFNEETYAQAKPLFIEATRDVQNAAADIKEIMRRVYRMVADMIGHDQAVNMKPYMVRFVSDYQEGKIDEPTTSADPQSAGQDGAVEELSGRDPVHGRPAGAESADSQPVGKTGSERDGPAADSLVHDAGTPSGGTGRSDGLSDQTGEFRPDRDDAESSGPEGSGRAGTDGAAATGRESDGDAGKDVRQGDVKARQTFAEKVDAQKKAEKVAVKLGDKANIDATLPLLLDGQRQDVHFAEQRLAAPTGYGVLFANGTGTGKTYLSLGIVKRQIQSGKKNGVVIVPDDAVMKEWLASAPNLGINLYRLKDKQDKGQGVAITTYANLGDNMTLLDRDHDFVVADEAHNLMRSKDAVVTKPLSVVRALTMHPDSAIQRTDMIHRKLSAQIADLRAERDAIPADANGTMTRADAARAADIEAKLEPLYKDYRAKLDEQKDILANVKPEDRPRLVAVSATPFAWESNVQWAHGYLFDYPKVKETGAYNEPNPYQKFMIQNFGYRMRTGKLNEPDAKVDRSLMQVQFNMRLRKEGVLSTRMLDVDADYDRKFALVDGGIGARIDAAMKWLREAEGGKYGVFHKEASEQFDYLTQRRLLEAIKAKAAIDIIKAHHALGRKVVVWHDYNQGGGFAPFNFGGNPGDIIKSSVRDGGMSREVQFPRREFLSAFRAKFGDLMGDELAKLKSPIETLREAFPNALFNNGLEKKKDAEASIAKFNDDNNPDANLIVVQSAKNAGWSGHDKTGKFQRVSINLGLPTAPVASIQQEGRIYRTGQITNAIFRYLNTGTLFERIAFATSIATRSETTENMAMGDYARGLKKSFIEAFLDSGDYPASAEDGTGGKAIDRRKTEMTPFALAKAHYFGQEKKNSRNKAAEGNDYFATPEPLGQKMVEWLGAQAGNDLLEPSAGHGAIARWFPEDTNNKAIEQSDELAGRLRLAVSDPAGVIHGDFESHHISNKYDGIAMNPPFGNSGKLAMEHVAKAFGHLREGGRIVAIVPDGPAMAKRVTDWLSGTFTTPGGIVRLNNPDAVLTHTINLPPSTFARAGTSVATRVLIIDRVKNGNDGSAAQHSKMFTPHDVMTGDINNLFNFIEHMSVPGRVAPAEAAATSTASSDTTSTPAVTMHDHGRVVSDQGAAVFNVKGNKLETDAPVVKVTTQAGKVLEGVYVPDREMAKSVDAFTWKPKGETGYFVRIKHVIRPAGESPAMFSLGGRAVQDGKVVGAVTKRDADEAIGTALRGVPNGVQGIHIEVAPTFSALPADLLAEAASQKVTKAKGVFWNGTVYVVLDAHATKEDLQDTVFHELYGHAGLQKLFGQHVTTMLDQLYRNIGGKDGLLAIAKEKGIDLTAYNATYNDAAIPADERRRLMMEELLAHIAGQGPSFKQKVAAIIGAVKFRLRELGIGWVNRKLGAYDANDLARVLKNAHAALSKQSLQSEPTAGAARFALDDAPAAVNLRPAVAPKVGLLDTPMRLAFQKTGALAVWRGAFRLLEKTANKALDNKLGEIIKAGMIDRYGLSDAVIERHEEMRVKMIEGVRTADRFLDRLKGLSRNEYAVLYAAANNADTAAVSDMIKELPEDSQAALHEIKSLVRDLGQEAVDLKMLDADTFKANEMAYLHRSYLKHEAALTEGEKASRATRIKGDQFKARGLADIVSSDRLMKWMPEFWGTRVKNGAVTNDSIGQQFIRFERRDDPTPTANIQGVEGAPALGRLKEVVYWPVGEETPAKFADWHQEGEWAIRRTVGSNVVFRRDFSEAERKRMGEIEDIRYAMAKTINIATHDVEVGKYFGWLAEGHARVPDDLPAGAEVIDEPRKLESKLQTFGKDTWVKVPDTKVKGTGVSVYGKLAGRYIPGPIWSDIRAVNSGGAFFTSNVGKSYEKLLSLWKISKTALSPAVHVNNVMANVVMADWHDVSGTHLLRAAAAWTGQGKNAEHKKLVQDFENNGGELGTYALSEMQRSQLGPILDELLTQARADNDLNGIVNAAGALSLLRTGMLRQAAATVAQSKVGRVAGAIPAKMIDVYQLEDQIFRLAAFMKARESGLTDREAGRYARKSFLDYDIQAPWVVAAKRSGLLPFISFSYRAVPMLYQTLRDKPWKLMKLGLVLGAMSAASAAFLGLGPDDRDNERRWLPDEKSGNIWGMIPKMIRMPWNTKSDNPVFMDVRRFIPAGDVTDTGSGHGAIPLPPFLNIGGPLAIMAEMMTNKSQFTGQPITSDSDTSTEAALKVLDYAYKWAAPNIPLPGLGTITPGTEPGQFQSYSWTGIVNAAQRKEGMFGRDQNLPEAVGSAFGVKLEGYNPQTGEKNAEAAMKAKLQDLAKQKSSARKQNVQGGLSDAAFGRKLDGIQQKEQDIKKGFADRHN